MPAIWNFGSEAPSKTRRKAIHSGFAAASLLLRVFDGASLPPQSVYQKALERGGSSP